MQFWKPFFEAAAKTKLNDPYTEEESIRSEGAVDVSAGEGSLAFDDDASTISDPSQQGTPRAAAPVAGPSRSAASNHQQYSDDVSPFDALQADLSQIGIPSTHQSNLSALDQATKDVHRLRLGELPPDSPDVPVPEWETGLLSGMNGRGGFPAPSPSLSSIVYESSPGPSSARPTSTAASKHHPALLQKILRKNLASPAPPTPRGKGKGKLLFPSEASGNWNGIADLSNTSLAAFASPIKRQGDAADESGWDDHLAAGAHSRHLSSSPAPSRGEFASLIMSPAPRAGSSRTPAKEAAQRMSKDVYNAVDDSPFLSPPSVMKNWGTRNYDLINDSIQEPSFAPSPSEGKRKGFEEEAYGDDDEPSFELAPPTGNAAALADFGGGTTARIDDLLNEQSFARLVDDDEFGQRNLDEQDESYTVDAEHAGGAAHGQYAQDEDEEQYLVEEGISVDVANGPEDTLFGMGAKGHAAGGRSRSLLFQGDEEDDDSFQGGSGGAEGSQFRMMGPNDMDTLHGGALLESEPFEGSPLAGRDRRDY